MIRNNTAPLNHHLYADDTQLVFTFCPQMFTSQPAGCDVNISTGTLLYSNALQQISSWTTANLLAINSSKTEILLIGLKQQKEFSSNVYG